MITTYTLLLKLLVISLILGSLSFQCLCATVDDNPDNNDADSSQTKSEVRKLLRLGVFGWNSQTNKRLLYSLLGSPTPMRGINGTKIEDKISSGMIYKFNDNAELVLQEGEISGRKLEAAFLLLDETMLVNEQHTITEIINCFGSLNHTTVSTNNTHQPVIVVVLGGSEVLLAKVQTMLKEAWTHYRTYHFDQHRTEDLFDALQIRFIVAPAGLDEKQKLAPTAIEAMNKLLTELLNICPEVSDHNEEAMLLPSSEISISVPKRKAIISENDHNIMEVFQEAVQVGLQLAVELVNDEQQKYFVELNKLQENSLNFSNLLEEIITKCFKKQFDFITNSTRLNISDHLRTTMQKELLLRIYKSFAPLFHRQVQLLKQLHIQEFNSLTTIENLPITIHIDEDLGTIKRQIVKSFHDRIQMLLPQSYEIKKSLNIGIYWNGVADIYELSSLLSEFIEKQILRYRLLGVLSRQVRKPIALAAHAFIAHPLGIRDYRQLVLTSNELGDSIYYDAELVDLLTGNTTENVKKTSDSAIKEFFKAQKTVDVDSSRKQQKQQLSNTWNSPTLIRPKLARQILQQQINDMQDEFKKKDASSIATKFLPFSFHSLLNFSPLRKLKAQSEAAREMLMFPLFIKNPDVPLSSFGPPQQTVRKVVRQQSSSKQPERFIRWDIQPLQEVKQNLDIIVKNAEKPISWFDKIVAKYFVHTPMYQHPIINYGKKYTS